MRQQRIRIKDTRRWSKEDTIKLLEILKMYGDKIQKPSAQIFFSKIIESEPTLAHYTWLGMRDKLKNLKIKYKQAIDWWSNLGDGLQEADKEVNIKDYILKICPEFELMDDIFGGRPNISVPYVSDRGLSPTQQLSQLKSENSPPEPDSLDPAADNVEFVISVEGKGEVNYEVEVNPSSDSDSAVVSAFRDQLTKRPRNTSSTSSLVTLAEVQKERTIYLQEKLKLDKEMFEEDINIKKMQLQLDREKIDLERRKHKEDVRLKELEINKKYELQKMELEHALEIRKYELKLKFDK